MTPRKRAIAILVKVFGGQWGEKTIESMCQDTSDAGSHLRSLENEIEAGIIADRKAQEAARAPS